MLGPVVLLVSRHLSLDWIVVAHHGRVVSRLNHPLCGLHLVGNLLILLLHDVVGRTIGVLAHELLLLSLLRPVPAT